MRKVNWDFNLLKVSKQKQKKMKIEYPDYVNVVVGSGHVVRVHKEKFQVDEKLLYKMKVEQFVKKHHCWN